MLSHNYNKLTQEQRRNLRIRYSHHQNNECYHCKNSLDDIPSNKMLSYKINKKLFPKSFFDYPVHLHHSHKTGMTIGSVHSLCNAILWQYHSK